MRWRLLLSRRKREESQHWDELRKLMLSEALHNRAALNLETLKLYHDMFSDPDPKLVGERFMKLVSALMREKNFPIPTEPRYILAFLAVELRGFDTPEATEVRQRAELEEMKRLLNG